MSDSKPAEAEAHPAAPAAPRASKLTTILVGLNLAATGFVVFKLMTAPTSAAAAPSATPAAPKEPPSPTAEVKGPVVALDPFVVNLDEPGNPRYLKATIQLELEDDDAMKSFENAKQPVRDQVLGYLSGLKVADTLGEANKQKIRDGVLGRVTAAVGKGKVRRLFFSEFMVQ